MLILLNGASSAGKTTLARELQAHLPMPFWHFSIDHLREAGVLPLTRYRRGDFRWSDDRERFFDGFHRSLPVFAAAGNNLIVEHIVETPTWMALLVELLAPFDLFFVGVHCPLDELERRELARGDRPLGDARRDAATVHRHALYDYELDTCTETEPAVNRLIDAWMQRRRPTAFARMHASGLPSK